MADDDRDTRLHVPFWRDAGHWFGWSMVAATFGLGLWHAGAFGYFRFF